MKLADTYTNLCFVALIVNTYAHWNVEGASSQRLPLYMVIITLASMGIYIIGKAVLVIYFIVFTIRNVASTSDAINNKEIAANELSPKKGNNLE